MNKFDNLNQIINEFENSRKAYQIVQAIKTHLPDADPKAKVSVRDDCDIISVQFFEPGNFGRRLYYYTKLTWLRGQTFVVNDTQIHDLLQGKNMYELCADFRDLVAIKFGAVRLVSTINKSNVAMVKAATKNHWNQISISGTAGLWLKELPL